MRQTHQRPSRLRNGRGVEPAVRPGGGCAGSGWWRTGMGSLAAPEKGVLPPVGNTGVEPGPEVSWLLGTLRSEDPAKEGRRVWSEVLRPLLGGEWRQSGAKHYGKGFRLDDWSAGVYWDGQGDAKGTAMVEVRQSALDGLPKSARLDLLRLVRPRRLDLACDDGYQRCRPRDLFHAAREARSRSRKDRWRLEMTSFGALTTLYVGSRSSEAMLRVYDKPPQGVRHELELKAERAEQAGSRLLAGWSVSSVYCEAYRRVVEFPSVAGWSAFLEGAQTR